MKDAESEGHSRRVTLYTIAIAQAMGIPRGDIAKIARGAFLHDIGNMAVPDTILRKSDQLTPDEVSIMRTHPYRGCELVNKIPFLAVAAEIVYSHQERYDGAGYPRGLRATKFLSGHGSSPSPMLWRL